MPFFEVEQGLTFLIEQVERDDRGDQHTHCCGTTLDGLILDPAQDMKRRRLGGTDMTQAAAMRAGF